MAEAGSRAAGPSRGLVRAHFDARAAIYDQSAMHLAVVDAVADWLQLAGDESVLDVATGTGLMLRSLVRRWPGVTGLGVDISPGMLAVAAAALPTVAFVLSDASAVPLRDRSTDLVTCITALHLLAEPRAALDEWFRVLRPGGRLVTATFATPDDFVDRQDGIVRNHAAFATPERVAALGWPLVRWTRGTYGGDPVLICQLRRP